MHVRASFDPRPTAGAVSPGLFALQTAHVQKQPASAVLVLLPSWVGRRRRTAAALGTQYGPNRAAPGGGPLAFSAPSSVITPEPTSNLFPHRPPWHARSFFGVCRLFGYPEIYTKLARTEQSPLGCDAVAMRRLDTEYCLGSSAVCSEHTKRSHTWVT